MMARLGWLAVAGALAGCSDGGGGSGSSSPSYDDLIAEGDAIDAESIALGFTDPAGLPTTGRASYEGVVALGVGDPDSTQADLFLAGELELAVDFSRSVDAVTGSADNFVSDGGERFDGALAITEGDLNRGVDPNGGGWTYEADINGTLTDEGGGDYDFAGDVLGDFLGQGHGYATGIAVGDVNTPNGAQVFGGGFIAER